MEPLSAPFSPISLRHPLSPPVSSPSAAAVNPCQPPSALVSPVSPRQPSSAPVTPRQLPSAPVSPLQPRQRRQPRQPQQPISATSEGSPDEDPFEWPSSKPSSDHLESRKNLWECSAFYT
ncbi:merozoite surface protein CMZ-8-like [Penaeus vannamei]|uniref:merozoite surface protein CMZ-8-like n=1 Tax=Penaeus vannamei TaxID=6689 RepID=UPI00387F9C3B